MGKLLSIVVLMDCLLGVISSSSHAAEAYIHAATHAILTKANGRVATEFEMAYGLRTTSPTEDICTAFPAEAFGGSLTSCDAYSPQGLVITFESPVSWDRVWVIEPDSPIEYAEPPELLVGTGVGSLAPFTSSVIAYRDSRPWIHLSGSETNFRFDTMFLLPASDANVFTPWSASVCIEPRATYTNAQGAVVGSMLASEVGGAESCATVDHTQMFSQVPLDDSSWGQVKALY